MSSYPSNRITHMHEDQVFVPPAFVLLIKTSLFRLVAAGMLPKHLVCEEFWKLMKNKFDNAAGYARRLQRLV